MHKERTGRFLGLPYDFRRPTVARFKQRVWNPNDDRILTPHVFGWGYTINLHSLLRRIGLLKPRRTPR